MTSNHFDSLFEMIFTFSLAIAGVLIGFLSLIAWVTGTHILTDPPKVKPPIVRKTEPTHRKPWFTVTIGRGDKQ